MSNIDQKDFRVVIGLGNPDKRYENTYHNAGFLLISYLEENRQNSKFGIRSLKLFRSENYMNESGGFVKKIAKKYGVEPKDILVAHDDSDIELGSYKLSFGRNSAGHKGVKSVIESLGTKDFWRLRIGIRPKIINPKSEIRKKAGLPAVAQRANPPSLKLRREKAGEFVLKKISAADKKTLTKTFERIAECFSLKM